MGILDLHLPIPQPRQLIQHLTGFLVLDRPPNGIVRAGEVSLGFELYIGDEVILGTPHVAVIAELILHLSEKDPAGVHVWLREDTVDQYLFKLVVKNILSLSLFLILPPVQQSQYRNSLHETRGRITQKLTPRFQRPVDADVMLRGHEEVARFWGMVGCLFSDVIAAGSVIVVPVAGEGLAEDGIEGFLDASDLISMVCHTR